VTETRVSSGGREAARGKSAASGRAGSPAAPALWGPARVALRSDGIRAPSSSAPATQARPPLTTEIVSDDSCATIPASVLPSAGAVFTCARYRLLSRPRSRSGA